MDATGNYEQQFNIPHLPTCLGQYISLVVSMYNLGCNQCQKPDWGVLDGIQELQILVFADPVWEMDYLAIDAQMVYLLEYVLMPADYLEHQ